MSTPEPLLLMIEDDLSIRKFLRSALAANGYRILESVTGKDGLLQSSTQVPDVVILDLGLPDMDGIEVVKKLRAWSAIPILVLSARGQERDKVAALDAGADDYVAKPFGIVELMARIRVALRHASRTPGGATASSWRGGEIEIDLEKRRVLRSGAELHLTPVEFRLLACLVKNAGKVVTHKQILREVWGPSSENESQYLRVYMGQLRRKLEEDPARPRHLLTEQGVGYRLVEEEPGRL